MKIHTSINFNNFLSLLSCIFLKQTHLVCFKKKPQNHHLNKKEKLRYDSHPQTFKPYFIIKWNTAKSLYQIYQIFSHSYWRINAQPLFLKKK